MSGMLTHPMALSALVATGNVEVTTKARCRRVSIGSFVHSRLEASSLEVLENVESWPLEKSALARLLSNEGAEALRGFLASESCFKGPNHLVKKLEDYLWKLNSEYLSERNAVTLSQSLVTRLEERLTKYELLRLRRGVMTAREGSYIEHDDGVPSTFQFTLFHLDVKSNTTGKTRQSRVLISVDGGEERCCSAIPPSLTPVLRANNQHVPGPNSSLALIFPSNRLIRVRIVLLPDDTPHFWRRALIEQRKNKEEEENSSEGRQRARSSTKKNAASSLVRSYPQNKGRRSSETTTETISSESISRTPFCYYIGDDAGGHQQESRNTPGKLNCFYNWWGEDIISLNNNTELGLYPHPSTNQQHLPVSKELGVTDVLINEENTIDWHIAKVVTYGSYYLFNLKKTDARPIMTDESSSIDVETFTVYCCAAMETRLQSSFLDRTIKIASKVIASRQKTLEDSIEVLEEKKYQLVSLCRMCNVPFKAKKGIVVPKRLRCTAARMKTKDDRRVNGEPFTRRSTSLSTLENVTERVFQFLDGCVIQ